MRKRAKVICEVPGCMHWSAPRVMETQIGEITDEQILCPDHWRGVPLKFRRAYRRARNAARLETTQEALNRCNRLWRWLVRDAIERSVGI